VRIGPSLLVVASLLGCSKPAKPRPIPQAAIIRGDGLITQVLAPGSGDEAKSGDKITVHYLGTIKEGPVFANTREKDQPFSFWVGERQVIQGWDDGLLGMREGELRRITVPPELGYGSEPKPGIPPGSTLIFEVELLDVR
jgi:FKBP-type peptidyl-prolyl cis-trans isomerase